MEGAPAGAPPESRTRKPYTITKQRECWTEEEHQRFLDALKLHGRAWRKIEECVGTKTAVQIRSHAQKYFLKISKSDNGESVPPPRPKKRSSQPYPQKAAPAAAKPAGHDAAHAAPEPPARTPDFALVYRFIAKVIDPLGAPDAPLLPELRGMHPLDRGTAVALMNTIARNLCSPAMWDTQTKYLCEGKPSFVTIQPTGGGSGFRFAGAGGVLDVGGGLFRGAPGGGAGEAALQREMSASLPGVYSRPFLAGPPAAPAAPAPAPAALLGVGMSGESIAVAAAVPRELMMPLLVEPPPPQPAQAVLPPLGPFSAMLAPPPGPVPEPPPPPQEEQGA